jgi:hypothetical protein
LKKTFKWINNNEIELASFGNLIKILNNIYLHVNELNLKKINLTKGYRNEGWIDPVKYLIAVRKKATSMGAEYLEGELTSIEEDKVEYNPNYINETGIKLLSAAIVKISTKIKKEMKTKKRLNQFKKKRSNYQMEMSCQ